jgi:hypothetical protein
MNYSIQFMNNFFTINFAMKTLINNKKYKNNYLIFSIFFYYTPVIPYKQKSQKF